VPVDDPAGLADGLIEVLEDRAVRDRYIEKGSEAVRRYDWPVVAGQIMRVYETVAGSGAKVRVAGTAGPAAAASSGGRGKVRGSR
jgi:phosphatidylinositol alpha-mannosyltransferase